MYKTHKHYHWAKVGLYPMSITKMKKKYRPSSPLTKDKQLIKEKQLSILKGRTTKDKRVKGWGIMPTRSQMLKLRKPRKRREHRLKIALETCMRE